MAVLLPPGLGSLHSARRISNHVPLDDDCASHWRPAFLQQWVTDQPAGMCKAWGCRAAVAAFCRSPAQAEAETAAV